MPKGKSYGDKNVKTPGQPKRSGSVKNTGYGKVGGSANYQPGDKQKASNVRSTF